MIYNVDCFKHMSNMLPHSVDLIYADPPYDLNIFKEGSGGTVNNIGKLDKSLVPINNITLQNYDLNLFCEEAMRIMKDVNIYIWCNKKQIPLYIKYFVLDKGCKFDILVWNKTNALPTYSNKYLTDCEYCLYFHSAGKCFPKNYNDAKTVYYSPINRENKIYNHPTIKPLQFVKSMISNSAKPGDIVFDPFVGSGTAGVACKQLGIDFIGCEINTEYFKVAMDRINEENVNIKRKSKLI